MGNETSSPTVAESYSPSMTKIAPTCNGNLFHVNSHNTKRKAGKEGHRKSQSRSRSNSNLVGAANGNASTVRTNGNLANFRGSRRGSHNDCLAPTLIFGGTDENGSQSPLSSSRKNSAAGIYVKHNQPGNFRKYSSQLPVQNSPTNAREEDLSLVVKQSTPNPTDTLEVSKQMKMKQTTLLHPPETGSLPQNYHSHSQNSSAMVNNWLPAPGLVNGGRKHSYCEGIQLGTNSARNSNSNSPPTNGHHVVASGTAAAMINNRDRRRSRSLCGQQLKVDCQSVSANYNQPQPNGTTTAGLPSMNSNHQPKKNSIISSSSSSASNNGLSMPTLARLRIQQGFKNAKPVIGQQILKRACSLRSEIKMFLSCLAEEKVEELANDIHTFVTECVINLEEPEKVSSLSRAFGQMHAQLCQMGFRPEFFSTIADATIAECVRLDGGAHKRCETLLAWSQLMQFMFSNVRDGYYAEVRQQRRSSLPQHRFLLSKQASIVSQMDTRNNCNSFDMDL
ncbi:hypothetical protein DdX_06804 [Ditylenchus destructor]|uniref:Uncharacterized protein n=1 Tax=Ditylenchus destructor TaxID=166010 RepID=A0AAD4R8K8_9BILA|nr:hypothetical protein DdX_06804 [Ditylenchus destructor]